jgi:antitoxin YefM
MAGLRKSRSCVVALEETAYLLRTPANATRLLSAAAQLNAGKGVERKLAK